MKCKFLMRLLSVVITSAMLSCMFPVDSMGSLVSTVYADTLEGGYEEGTDFQEPTQLEGVVPTEEVEPTESVETTESVEPPEAAEPPEVTPPEETPPEENQPEEVEPPESVEPPEENPPEDGEPSNPDKPESPDSPTDDENKGDEDTDDKVDVDKPDDGGTQNKPVNKNNITMVENLINKLNSGNVSKSELEAIKSEYNKLSKEEKKYVLNYNLLLEYEKKLDSVSKNDITEDVYTSDDTSDEGYYEKSETQIDSFFDSISNGSTNTLKGSNDSTNATVNGFYSEELRKEYKLTFSKNFADVMESVEKEYKKENKIFNSDIVVENWQDILAVYVLEQRNLGITEFDMNKYTKQDLLEIFSRMNPIKRDKKNLLNVYYDTKTVNDYLVEHRLELTENQKNVLKKYTSKDCSLLCALVTASDGFIRGSVGSDTSDERINVLKSAYKIIGKTNYKYNGMAKNIGISKEWVNKSGLGSGGFVNWAIADGYGDSDLLKTLGGTTNKLWKNCITINANDAQAGDLVFDNSPESKGNHSVGILAGQSEDGDWIAIYCSSSKNGVVVEDAYSAGFRYIRRHKVFTDSVEDTKEPTTLEGSDSYLGSLKSSLGSLK